MAEQLVSRKDGYRTLLRYPRSVWRWLVVAGGLGALASALAAAQPLPLALLVDHALGDQPLPSVVGRVLDAAGVEPSRPALVVTAAVVALVIAVAAAATGSALGWLWEYIGRRMVRDLKVDLFDRLQRRSLTDLRRREMGDTLSRLATDSWSVYSVTHALVSAPSERLLTMVVVAVAAWHLNPLLAALTLGVALPLGIVTYRLGIRLRPATAGDRKAQAGVVSAIDQLLSALPLVQAFTAEERSRHLLRTRAAAAVAAGRRVALTSVVAQTAAGLLTSLSTAVVLVVGGLLVLDGRATLGTLLVFLAYLRVLDRETKNLLRTHRTLLEGSVGLDRVLELWGQETVIADPPEPVELPPPAAAGARVELIDVTVGYEPDRPVLRHLDLAVNPGETVALVGLSGAGKSTLAALLPRFLDPWSGAVRLDGVDLRHARVHDIRRRVAVVHQDTVLLPGSVSDNIAYGRPDASPADIRAAARQAGAHDFITQLAHGYDTVLGEGGSNLSGGQRQRLAIARAFLKDAPLLVLDEPTSALDSHTEAHVVDTLRRIGQHRTVIVIAHRHSTIQHVDRVITLHDGTITNTHPPLEPAHGP